MSEHHATLGPRQLVGREAEQLEVLKFLAHGGPAICLALVGASGIGKTSLWAACLETAAARGYVVLAARASQAEVLLPFAAMADLLDGVGSEALAALPAPQLDALEVALRRRHPAGTAPDPFAVSAGFLGVLSGLAARGPLLVAIDDAQWLDPSSESAVLFASRRLADGRARFLITRRAGSRAALERVFPSSALGRLEVGPLGFGATNHVLAQTYGPVLTRRVLHKIHQASQGNPLFALEVGRLLLSRGAPEIGDELPVPELFDDIFASRIRELAAPVGRALLAVALSAGITPSELATLVDPLVLQDAIAAGVLTLDRSHVRPAHPMLAVAARHQASARERRGLHLELASAAGDATLRARHLALATLRPDTRRASIVAAAAELAARRGAVQDAEELGAHALRLTPATASERTDRILALARFHSRADEPARVTSLLTKWMADLQPGRARGMAHLLLGEVADVVTDEAHVELALAAAGDDPEVRALALAKKSRLSVQTRVARIDDSEEWALEALSAASQVGPDLEDRVRTALAWARVLRGVPIDDLKQSQPLSERPWNVTDTSIERPLAARLTFRGHLDQARDIFRQVLQSADERGDLQSARFVHQQLCELELRAGDVQAAARWLHEINPGPLWLASVRARLQAVLAAVTGDAAGALQWAAAVLESDASDGMQWDRLEARRAIALAALLEQQLPSAIENLGTVWQHTLREHVDDPGAFPVAPDFVEALVRTGDLDTATAVTERLRLAAQQQRHPWGQASLKRCAATLLLAERYDEQAAAELAVAASDYAALGLNFDQARTLLALGTIQRRHSQRTAARRSLEEAIARFDELGCSGWADRARSELSRVSGRRSPAAGQLTPSERRVVDLAVQGMSNKQIAEHLFVSLNTVETHLTHAFTKLHVRSRAQLATAISATND